MAPDQPITKAFANSHAITGIALSSALAESTVPWFKRRQKQASRERRWQDSMTATRDSAVTLATTVTARKQPATLAPQAPEGTTTEAFANTPVNMDIVHSLFVSA